MRFWVDFTFSMILLYLYLTGAVNTFFQKGTGYFMRQPLSRAHYNIATDAMSSVFLSEIQKTLAGSVFYTKIRRNHWKMNKLLDFGSEMKKRITKTPQRPRKMNKNIHARCAKVQNWSSKMKVRAPKARRSAKLKYKNESVSRCRFRGAILNISPPHPWYYTIAGYVLSRNSLSGVMRSFSDTRRSFSSFCEIFERSSTFRVAAPRIRWR